MPSTQRLRRTLPVLCFALLAGSAARGQTPEDKAAAQIAFDKAMDLMNAGKTDQACPLLEDSQRLDPAMGTQYQLGQCYEQTGRLASAWATYAAVADAARAADMPDREHWARERADALAPQLSKLTIVVPPTLAALDGLSIERDESPVPRTLWGAAIPVDGGVHRVVARAPDHLEWSVQVEVARAQDSKRIQVALARPAKTAAGAPTAGPTPTPAASPADQEQTGAGGSAQAVAGIVLASVGTAALVAGVAVGLAAKSSYDESGDEHCIDTLCDTEGVDAADDARAMGNVATVLFVGGGAVLVAGVVTWLTAPATSDSNASADAARKSGPRLALAPGPGDAGLGLTIRW